MWYNLRTVLFGAVVVLLQWLLLGRLKMWDAYPDITLLFVVLVALNYKNLAGPQQKSPKLAGAYTGFFIGLALDVIYGTLGIQMFAKTLVGALVGAIAERDQEFQISRPRWAFVAAVVISLVQNGVLAILVALQFGGGIQHLVMVLWIGCSIYTGMLALFLSMLDVRRRM